MEGNRWYGLNPEVAESIGPAVNHEGGRAQAPENRFLHCH